jgi:hypothetical protein
MDSRGTKECFEALEPLGLKDVVCEESKVHVIP